jgi:hypothetical protein
VHAERPPQLMRGPLGRNASTVAVQGALRRALAIKQGQLGLLNEEQKTVRGRLNWQRTWRQYLVGHRGPPALARLTDSDLRTVPSIPPRRQAGVKSVKELLRCAVHGGLLPNKRMQLMALQV